MVFFIQQKTWNGLVEVHTASLLTPGSAQSSYACRSVFLCKLLGSTIRWQGLVTSRGKKGGTCIRLALRLWHSPSPRQSVFPHSPNPVGFQATTSKLAYLPICLANSLTNQARVRLPRCVWQSRILGARSSANRSKSLSQTTRTSPTLRWRSRENGSSLKMLI